MITLLRHCLTGLLLGLSLENAAAATFPLPTPETGVVGSIQVIYSKYQDTLLDIALRYDLGYNEIIAANPGVDPWLPGEHTRIVLPTQFVLPDAPHQGLVLNLAAMRLYYFPPPRKGEQPLVMTYPVGIGRLDWQTPLGTTKIVSKVVNPVWYAPASIRKEHAENGDKLPAAVPAGPDNPLGKYALKLGLPGYLIHGTNKSYGIGSRVSHGCVRLYPGDIEELFKRIDIDTPVRFIDEPYHVGWLEDSMYLQVYRALPENPEEHALNLTSVVRTIMKHMRSDHFQINWGKAFSAAQQARSTSVRISGPPILLTDGEQNTGRAF